MNVWSNTQIEQWHLLYRTYMDDLEAVANNNGIDLRRRTVQHELLHLLRSFLDGKATLAEFNSSFQQKTHNGSNVFNLRGMSGGLFLNKLVKHVPSEDTFGHLFRLMLRVPEEAPDERRQMQAFVRFLEGLIASGQITRAQLQPARVPFFLSAWWHIQDPERWPIFYLDARQAILLEESHDPIEGYFVFRMRFLALTEILGITSWELEHLATWHVREQRKAGADDKKHSSSPHKQDTQHAHPQRQVCVIANREDGKTKTGSVTQREESNAHLVSCRTHLQWLLAKLGHKVGCQVWIAINDHSKVCQNERLGDLSLPSLPTFADSPMLHILRQIDVLWLLDNGVVAGYEVEQAHTDVSTSLLRLYDLASLFPTSDIRLCVVAPEDRFEKVRFELSRPTFREQDRRKRCALISEEFLLQQETHILRWASSPAVIQDLIHQGNEIVPSGKNDPVESRKERSKSSRESTLEEKEE